MNAGEGVPDPCELAGEAAAEPGLPGAGRSGSADVLIRSTVFRDSAGKHTQWSAGGKNSALSGGGAMNETESTWRRIRQTVLVVAAIVALAICAWIEVLNHRAGGTLPRSLPEEGNGRWGTMSMTALRLACEKEYRIKHELEYEAPLPAGAAAEIEARFAELAPRYRADAALKGTVQTLGLLQYPLALWVCVYGFLRACASQTLRWRSINALCAMAGLAGLTMAWYRSYFTSLGW